MEEFKFTMHDLKIDNIVFDSRSGGRIVSVDAEMFVAMNENIDYFNETYAPVPLTAQWLEKFKFSDADYKPGYIGKDYKSGSLTMDFVLSKPLTKGEWNKSYTFDFPQHRFKSFEFVHELQNFYYEMTCVMLGCDFSFPIITNLEQ